MKQQPDSRQLGTGTWLSIGSPVIAELAAACGFDWLLFDLEHGCLTESGLLANLQAAKREGVRLIVRVGSMDSALIARVLDWGASGIMLPHVSTAEQARECVKAMNYPPIGTRGYSSSARSFSYGLHVQQNTLQQPLFIPQIENEEGVLKAESIAAVDGVDILFVGPADLKLDLSIRRPTPPISYETALQQVSLAAKNQQKQAGILVRNRDDLPALKHWGYSCLAIGSDLGMIRDGLLAATIS
ncbi:HpcH/HpaI aldolase family protein [Larkinella rosea]|uniref:2-dehydro-3-deoxyglucarate aldolase n=1 Tax=Larkinella rosea TaxID=2025312 RepID=A0A3P1BPQ3_9BACT|nr:aldolase/citrate lyase family protein [Larkinella rosea]RRB02514.1 2-dehydro-3-deoxyglucarate aldolase [Larkinella rosea]